MIGVICCLKNRAIVGIIKKLLDESFLMDILHSMN